MNPDCNFFKWVSVTRFDNRGQHKNLYSWKEQVLLTPCIYIFVVCWPDISHAKE